MRLFIGSTVLVIVLAAFGGAALLANYHQGTDDAVANVERTARLAGALGSSLVTLVQQELVVLSSSEAIRSGDPAAVQQAVDAVNPPGLGFNGGLWWLDGSGAVAVRWAGSSDIDVVDTEAVDEARSAGRPAVESRPAEAGSSMRSLVFAVPAPIAVGGSGMLVGAVDIDASSREVVAGLFGTDAVVAVDTDGKQVLGVDVDARSLRLAAAAARRVAAPASGERPATFLEPVVGVIPDIDGSVVAYSKSPSIDWVIVVERRRSELLAPLRSQLERSATALGLLVVASLLGAALVSTRIARMHRRETESGQLFQTVLEQLPVGVVALDRAGKVVVTNQRADVALGGRATTGEDAPESLQAAVVAVRSNDSVVDPDVVLGVDGEADARRLVVRAAPVRSSGTVAGAAAIVEDVTERRAREERDRRLAEASAGLAGAATPEDIAAVVVDAMSVFGSEGTIVVLRDLLRPDQLILTSTAGFGREDTEGWERIPLDSGTPVAEAARTGEPVFVTRDHVGDRFPTMRHLFERSTNLAWGALPLHSAGRVDGAIGLSFPDLADIAEPNRTQLIGFVAQVSQALDRASRQRIEHDVALVLQRGLLQPADGLGDCLELATRYRPAEDHLEVGGDFFDTVPLEDGSILLVIGDVVGHGIEAASAMGQLRSAVRALSATTSSPARLLELLDRFVGVVPPCRFATVAIVVVAPDRATVRYSTAGHPPPAWVRPTGETGRLDAAGSRPLGVSPSTRPEATFDAAGVTFCLYTDGLVERRGEVIDDGLDRLARVLEAQGALSCERLADRLLADVGGGARQRDDIALLVARVPAPPAGD